MYCNNCGGSLNGFENYCPNCGKLISNTFLEDKSINKSTENARTVSIVLGGLSLGGIFLVIFAPVSLILSIIGLVLGIKSNKYYKNTIGIVLNSIGLFLSFILTGVFALMIYFVVDEINNGQDGYRKAIDRYIEEHMGENDYSERF